MTDCPNVEIRELLPDYLGGTLSARPSLRSRVAPAGCQDCAEELALLQLVRRRMTATTPSVNVGAIVACAADDRQSRPVVRSMAAQSCVPDRGCGLFHSAGRDLTRRRAFVLQRRSGFSVAGYRSR